MDGFAVTLVAEVSGPGPLTFTQISDEGAVVIPGLTEFVFPNNGKKWQVTVIDASNSNGAFAYRLNYRSDSGIERLIDIVGPSAGEVLKSFANETPLLEVLGNGVRALQAEAIQAVGAVADGNLTVIVVQRET
ncbi:MAG TPA: hypothetical protein VEK15_20520 [Vicinamibacteria bacterium]|nr:hypothetical protein [Vicinamibacteria bacterium]